MNVDRYVVDVWFKKGQKAARHADDLEEAIISTGKLPKSEERSFIRGYYSGRVQSAIEKFQKGLESLTNDQLVKLADELSNLSRNFDQEKSKEGS